MSELSFDWNVIFSFLPEVVCQLILKMAVFSDLCVSWREGNNKVEEKVKQLIRRE